jgi:hypothetical protein
MNGKPEIDQLILAYLLGDISALETEELADLLKRDGAARERFARLCEQEIALRDVAAAELAGTEEGAVADGRPSGGPGVGTGRQAWRRHSVVSALAAAAAVIAAILWLGRPGSPAIARVSGRPAGTVTVGRGREKLAAESDQPLFAGDAIHTGRGAKVRLSWFREPGAPGSAGASEETLLVVRPNTEMSLPAAGGGIERARLERGELFCSVAEQSPGRRLIITTPDAEVRVRGTVFTVSVDGSGTHLTVLEGKVDLASLREAVSVEVTSGHSATVGDGVPPAVRRETDGDSGIDFGSYRTFGNGLWRIERTGEGTVIRQENPEAGISEIVFGEPHRRRGVFCGQFRVLEVGNQAAADVGPLLDYPAADQQDPPGEGAGDAFVYNDFPKMGIGQWWNFNQLFEIGPGNKVTVKRLIWKADEPVPLARTSEVHTEPEHIIRTVGGAGLRCSGAAVEFRRLRFVDTGDDDARVETRLVERIQTARGEAANADLGNCSFCGRRADWWIEKTDTGPVVKQIRPDADSTLLLIGTPRWKKGIFSGQFKILPPGEETPVAPDPRRSVQVRSRDKGLAFEPGEQFDVWAVPCLYYPPHEGHSFAFSHAGVFFVPNARQQEPRVWARSEQGELGVWQNFIVCFEMTEVHGFESYMAAWAEGDPPPRTWYRRKAGPPLPGEVIQRRGRCNVGLVCKGARVYWRNLRLLDVVEAGPPDAGEPEAEEVF